MDQAVLLHKLMQLQHHAHNLDAQGPPRPLLPPPAIEIILDLEHLVKYSDVLQHLHGSDPPAVVPAPHCYTNRPDPPTCHQLLLYTTTVNGLTEREGPTSSTIIQPLLDFP